MKNVVFSDIHGNFSALSTVLNHLLNKQNIPTNNMICLGDVIGYNPFPEECMSLLNNLNIPIIKGNHEEAALNQEELSKFNPSAQKAMLWTKNKISKKTKEQIKNLPYSLLKDNILFVHGTPVHPETFMYLQLANDLTNLRYMMRNNIKIAFVGHSHVPAIIEGQIVKSGTAKPIIKNIRYIPSLECNIKNDAIYIINVGSIGQSRNGNPEAYFCLCDSDNNKIKIDSIPYNIDPTAQAIIDNGLDPILAYRLYEGM